jgi:hypothetical protein
MLTWLKLTAAGRRRCPAEPAGDPSDADADGVATKRTRKSKGLDLSIAIAAIPTVRSRVTGGVSNLAGLRL